MAPNNSKFAPEFRKPGDLILYEDWNAAMQEIVRLESDKVNRQGGDSLQGPLTIEAALAVDTTSTTSLELEVKGALKLADGVAVNQFSNDGSLSENSDSIVPTQKAVRTYVETAEINLNTAVQRIFVKGMILMWSGQINEIPTGWALCNGENGTPDLRDRFIMGAVSQESQNQFGEATKHSHSVEISESVRTDYDGRHYHNYPPGSKAVCRDKGGYCGLWFREEYADCSLEGKQMTAEDGLHSHHLSLNFRVNSSEIGDIKPKWYALAFIMKQ